MKYTAAILIVSDSCYNKTRVDLSGPTAKAILEEQNFEIKAIDIVPDDKAQIIFALKKYVKEGINLVVASGGTGFSKTDITPEATLEIIDKRADGISEAMRAHGMLFSDRAVLSRGVSGIKDNTVIINLPGSPKAVREDLEFILPTLIHGLDILNSRTSNCARKD